MKEKLPGKGLILIGSILLVVFGLIVFFPSIVQIPSSRELLHNVPDSVRTPLQISIYLDPVRGILAIAAGALGLLCYRSPQKWIIRSIILTSIMMVVEFCAIALLAYVMFKLEINEGFKYSLSLLAALIQVSGLAKLKQKLAQEARSAV